MKLYTMFRSLCVSKNVRKYQVQDVLYLQSRANMAGFYKVLCHVLHFGVLQPVANPRKSSKSFVLL